MNKYETVAADGSKLIVVTARTARETFEWLCSKAESGGEVHMLASVYADACARSQTCADLPLAPSDVFAALEGFVVRLKNHSPGWYHACVLTLNIGKTYCGLWSRSYYPDPNPDKFLVFLEKIVEDRVQEPELLQDLQQQIIWMREGPVRSDLKSQ